MLPPLKRKAKHWKQQRLKQRVTQRRQNLNNALVKSTCAKNTLLGTCRAVFFVFLTFLFTRGTLLSRNRPFLSDTTTEHIPCVIPTRLRQVVSLVGVPPRPTGRPSGAAHTKNNTE